MVLVVVVLVAVGVHPSHYILNRRMAHCAARRAARTAMQGRPRCSAASCVIRVREYTVLKRTYKILSSRCLVCRPSHLCVCRVGTPPARKYSTYNMRTCVSRRSSLARPGAARGPGVSPCHGGERVHEHGEHHEFREHHGLPGRPPPAHRPRPRSHARQRQRTRAVTAPPS